MIKLKKSFNGLSLNMLQLIMLLVFLLQFNSCKKTPLEEEELDFFWNIYGNYEGTRINSFFGFLSGPYFVGYGTESDTFECQYFITQAEGGGAINVTIYPSSEQYTLLLKSTTAEIKTTNSVVFEYRQCGYVCNYNTFTFVHENNQFHLTEVGYRTNLSANVGQVREHTDIDFVGVKQ